MSWVVGSGCGCGCGCGSWVCVNVVGHKGNKRILYKYKWTLKRHLGGK